MAILAQNVITLVDLPSDTDVSLFIGMADLVVSEDLADMGYSQARLDTIGLYLAAHFVVISNERGGLASHYTGSEANDYVGGDGKGFGSTRFGEQAMVFDRKGRLKELSVEALPAKFNVIKRRL